MRGSAKWMQFFCGTTILFLMSISGVDGQATYPLQLVVYPGGGFENAMQINDTQYQSFKQKVCKSTPEPCAEMWASSLRGPVPIGIKETVVTQEISIAISGTTMYYSCKQFATLETTTFVVDCCLSYTSVDVCPFDSGCSQLPAVKCQNGNKVILTWTPEQNATILNYNRHEMEVSSCCPSNSTTISASAESPTTTTPTTSTASTSPTTTTTANNSFPTSQNTNPLSSTSKDTTPSSNNTTPKASDEPNILVFVGIGIGVALASVIVTSVVCVLLRRKRKRNSKESDSKTFTGKRITSAEKTAQVQHEYTSTVRNKTKRESKGPLPEDDYDYIGFNPDFVDDGYEHIIHESKPSDVIENENEAKIKENVDADYIVATEPPYFERLDRRCVDADDDDYLTPVVPGPTLPPRPDTTSSQK